VHAASAPRAQIRIEDRSLKFGSVRLLRGFSTSFDQSAPVELSRQARAFWPNSTRTPHDIAVCGRLIGSGCKGLGGIADLGRMGSGPAEGPCEPSADRGRGTEDASDMSAAPCEPRADRGRGTEDASDMRGCGVTSARDSAEDGRAASGPAGLGERRWPRRG
jgi:hypothetical protein